MRPTPRRWRSGVAVRCALAALAAVCSAAGSARAEPAAGALRIRLVFPAEADLDLLVTGPSHETVYFANSPARSDGARLDGDRRCGAPAPRVETVTYPEARPGPYTVGVDFPEACSGGSGTVAYRIVVEQGEDRLEREGTISLGTFQPRALEFER